MAGYFCCRRSRKAVKSSRRSSAMLSTISPSSPSAQSRSISIDRIMKLDLKIRSTLADDIMYSFSTRQIDVDHRPPLPSPLQPSERHDLQVVVQSFPVLRRDQLLHRDVAGDTLRPRGHADDE